MLNQADRRPSEFEWSLHHLVESLGAKALGQRLGIAQRYLSRMANPWDTGAHFRASHLEPALAMGLERLPAPLALAPVAALARAVGCGLYPLPREPRPADVIMGLARLSRAHGDLGEAAVVAIDPRGEHGPCVSRSELMVIEAAGYDLASQAAAVMQSARFMHQGD